MKKLKYEIIVNGKQTKVIERESLDDIFHVLVNKISEYNKKYNRVSIDYTNSYYECWDTNSASITLYAEDPKSGVKTNRMEISIKIRRLYE